MRFLRRILADESGLETVEYAVIAGLIVSGLVALIVSLGDLTLTHLKGLARSLYGSFPGSGSGP